MVGIRRWVERIFRCRFNERDVCLLNESLGKIEAKWKRKPNEKVCTGRGGQAKSFVQFVVHQQKKLQQQLTERSSARCTFGMCPLIDAHGARNWNLGYWNTSLTWIHHETQVNSICIYTSSICK